MNLQQILLFLVLGGLLGTVGQGIRVIIGLKKLSEANKSKEKGYGEEFSSSRLFISLLIGFCAGILAVVGLVDFNDPKKVIDYAKLITAIIAAGYAGTDFIEGFMRRNLPLSKQDNITQSTVSSSTTHP